MADAELQARFEVAQGEWSQWMRRYAAAVRKDVGEALEDEMRRVLVAAAGFTPPFPSRGFGQAQAWVRPTTRSGKQGARTFRWADHKAAGRNAIVKDLMGRAGRDEGIFSVKPAGWFETVFDAIELLGSGGGMETTRYSRALMVATIRNALPLGWEQSSVRAEWKRFLEPHAPVQTMRRHHERHRSRNTGRVYRRSRRTSIIGRARTSDEMVVTQAALDRYLRQAGEAVGTLKAGWVQASEALGLGQRWPAWIRSTRPRGGGAGMRRMTGNARSLTAINKVAYAGKQDARTRIVTNALRFAAENLQRQVEARERGAWGRTRTS